MHGHMGFLSGPLSCSPGTLLDVGPVRCGEFPGLSFDSGFDLKNNVIGCGQETCSC